jgi:hypothetical protein
MKLSYILIGLCILFLVTGITGCNINNSKIIELGKPYQNRVGYLHNPQNKTTSGFLGGIPNG